MGVLELVVAEVDMLDLERGCAAGHFFGKGERAEVLATKVDSVLELVHIYIK